MADWNEKVIIACGLKPLPLDSKLRNLQGRTDVFDKTINRVDTWLERMPTQRGLKFRLARSAQQVMQRLLVSHMSKWSLVTEVVSAGFEHYRMGATYACEERLDSLRPQPSTKSPDEELHRKIILNEYLAVLKNESFVPKFITRAGFVWLVSEVVARGDPSKGIDSIER